MLTCDVFLLYVLILFLFKFFSLYFLCQLIVNMWAWEHCRINSSSFLAVCRTRRLNQGSLF